MKYFMHYLWRRPFFQTDWIPATMGTSEHPIDAIVRMKKIGKGLGEPRTEEYMLVSWQRVDADEVKTEEWWNHIG